MFNPKTHLGIYGVLVHEQKILLIKKARGPYTGKLDLPGGKLEHGEDLVPALAREFMEETGVVVKDAKLITNLTTRVSFEYEGEKIDMYQVGLIYRVTEYETSDLATDLNFEDSLGAIWMEIEGIDTGTLSPFAGEVVRNYLDKN